MTGIDLENAHYHTGHNMPGYLPESDVLSADSAQEILSLLKDELDRQQGSYYEQCENDTIKPGTEDQNCDCEWCGIAADVHADMVSIHDGDMLFRLLSEGGNLNLYYTPPEGPMLVYWVNVIDPEESCEAWPNNE